MQTTRDTRFESVPVSGDTIVCVNPYSGTKRDLHVSYGGFTSYFEKRSLNSSRDRCWKDFEHYKVQVAPAAEGQFKMRFGVDLGVGSWDNYQLYIGTATNPYAFYGREFGDPGMLNSGLPGLYDPQSVEGEHFVDPPPDLQQYLSRAFRTMMPTVKSNLSLVNSVIELKDFKSVPHTLSGMRNIAKGIWRQRATLREILRSSSDGYLQAKFNILPLLSDIAGIRSALSSSSKRIRALISRAGRRQLAHFTCPIDSETRQTYDTAKSTFPTWNNGYDSVDHAVSCNYDIERFSYSGATFHAQMEYSYDYSRFQTQHAELLALLDSLGVNSNPAIIWNAIPWSFVVDWVVGVGRWLDSFKVGNMDPTIRIAQCLWSVRRTRTIVVQRRSNFPKYYGFSGPTIQDTTSTFPVVTETSYRRNVFVPTGASLTTSGLNLSELSLGSALVFSRGRNRKH